MELDDDIGNLKMSEWTHDMWSESERFLLRAMPNTSCHIYRERTGHVFFARDREGSDKDRTRMVLAALKAAVYFHMMPSLWKYSCSCHLLDALDDRLNICIDRLRVLFDENFYEQCNQTVEWVWDGRSTYLFPSNRCIRSMGFLTNCCRNIVRRGGTL